MRLRKLATRCAAIVAAVASIACATERADEGDNIPTAPLCEMAYTPAATSFELWSPDAERVVVRLYDQNDIVCEQEMERAEQQKLKTQNCNNKSCKIRKNIRTFL